MKGDKKKKRERERERESNATQVRIGLSELAFKKKKCLRFQEKNRNEKKKSVFNSH